MQELRDDDIDGHFQLAMKVIFYIAQLYVDDLVGRTVEEVAIGVTRKFFRCIVYVYNRWL